jgi:hypothetical protein
MWHVWRQEKCIQSFVKEKLSERDHLEDIGLDEKIILKWMLKKWDGGHGLE